MLDIFRREPDGGVLWMGTAKDEKEVKEIYEKFLAANPEYLILVSTLFYPFNPSPWLGRVRMIVDLQRDSANDLLG